LKKLLPYLIHLKVNPKSMPHGIAKKEGFDDEIDDEGE